jgi:hypothetical protein
MGKKHEGAVKAKPKKKAGKKGVKKTAGQEHMDRLAARATGKLVHEDRPGHRIEGRRVETVDLVPVAEFAFRAHISRSDRIMLVLAWARQGGAIHIGGVTYPTPDGWVDGWLLSHRSVGGPSGDRRLRQLRIDHPVMSAGGIEKRRRTVGGDTVIEYRLVKS